MKNSLKLFTTIVFYAVASPAFAQLGSGSPPPTAAQPDKFPNLTWTNNAGAGVTFNIYRGIVAGGAKGKINPAPVTPTNFRDTTAAFGVQNFYTVTAQRTSDGVESLPSNEASGIAVQGSPSSPSGLNVVVAILLKVGKGIIYAVTFGRINLFG